MRGTAAFVASAVALSFAGPALAQSTTVAPGSRVRLTPLDGSPPVIGRVHSASPDAFVLDGKEDATTTVPVASLRQAEVSHAATGRGFAAGVLAGAATYGLLWLAAGSGEDSAYGALAGGVLALPSSFVAARGAGRGWGVGKGALVGAGVTAAVGAVLVAVVAADDDFDDDDTAAALAVACGVGAGLGALSGATAAAVGRERWTPLSLGGVRVGLRPVRGGMALGVQVSF